MFVELRELQRERPAGGNNLQKRVHGDVDHARELSSPEPDIACKKERKRRKSKGVFTSMPFYIATLTACGVDDARFAGDDTIGGYSGIFKEFLIDIQLHLRITIATEDAFPKTSEFERIIQALFESKAQEAINKKCENI